MTFIEIFDMVIDSFFIATILVVLSMGIMYLYYRYMQKKWQHPLRAALFLLYLYMLIYITVFRGELYQNSTHTINLIPFDELLTASYYQAAVYGKEQALMILLYNVIGNIVWFIPFGVVTCHYVKRLTIKKVFVYSLVLSLSIEIMQFVFYTGVSDIDDIIFNVVGGLCGYAIYQWVKRRREQR